MTSNHVARLIWAGLSVIAAVVTAYLGLEAWLRWQGREPITGIVRTWRDRHLVAFLGVVLLLTFAGGMLTVHFLLDG